MMKIAGSGDRSVSISQRHGSADPDPYQNVTDLQHWKIVIGKKVRLLLALLVEMMTCGSPLHAISVVTS
jgi:hypothetical protein